MYDEEKLKQVEAKNIEYPDGSMHTLYEAEQKQRAYERKIRESKRILAAYYESIKNADDGAIKKAYQNIFNKESVKLKNREVELNNFCDNTGLLKRSDRVQKYGFNKSISQKVIDSNNNFLINSNYNDIIYMKGKLSDPIVRRWYNVQNMKIYDLIDKTKFLKDQAKQAHTLRNQFKFQARELMKNQEERKMLDEQYPLQDFDYYFNKYKKDNVSDDDVYKKTIDSSMRPNKKVNQKFGLD